MEIARAGGLWEGGRADLDLLSGGLRVRVPANGQGATASGESRKIIVLSQQNLILL